MKKRRPEIFLSHITEEEKLAQVIKAAIERDFLDLVSVFVSSDAVSISAGSRWLETVDAALRRASLVIMLSSKLSIGRPWINFEAGAAWLGDAPLIPACHAGLSVGALPMPFAALHAVDLCQKAGLKRLYARIAEVLKCSPPKTELADLLQEIRAIDSAVLPPTSFLPPTVQHQDMKRLLGTWVGTAADIEIPDRLKYAFKLSYLVEIEFRLESGEVRGLARLKSQERQLDSTAPVTLIDMRGEHVSFEYRVADIDALHFGVTMMQILANGKEMRGYYLSKRMLETGTGFGYIELTKQPKSPS